MYKYIIFLAVSTLLSANQLSNKAEWFEAKGPNGKVVKYAGQLATKSTLLLTPSNGFFSRGVVASGKSKDKDMGSPFIKGDFGVLTRWDNLKETLRWHLWIPQKGKVTVTINLDTDGLKGKSLISVKLGHEEKVVMVEEVLKVVFNITKPGKNSFILQAKEVKGRSVARFISAKVAGSPIKSAKVLRARWRPAAVHSHFYATRLDQTSMWVMASRSASLTGSYSPITTPFGYYGASFGADQRVGHTMNFSMWSFGSHSETPPIRQWSHLIAAGSPDAEFSGFGHEGSGVKLRGGWKPLVERPKTLVQALRVEKGEVYDTYYGYYLDPKTGNWKLFAAGNKWSNGRKGKDISLWPGSFVEVPGPPSSERSGDLVREVLRKGWALSKSNEWYPMNSTGKINNLSNVNKFWRDGGEGWFSIGMGGMEHFDIKATEAVLINYPKDAKLPNYLAPSKLAQLYKMPVTFGELLFKQSAADKVTVEFKLPDAGTEATATVYYGEKDVLTFAPRKAHGTESKSLVEDSGNVWTQSKSMTAGDGVNSMTLMGLKPMTTYYFRILVVNKEGKQWNKKTVSYTTK